MTSTHPQLGLRILRGVSLLSAIVVMTACANMSGLGGTDKFTCTAPSGIPCRSISAVDHAVLTGQVDAASYEAQGIKPPEGHIPAALQSGSGGAREPRALPASAVVGDDADVSLGAIRSEPTVIRIWIAPYEDTDGDLVEASRVYLQVDNGRWLIDHNRARIRRDYAPNSVRPLQAGQAPANSAAPSTATPVPAAKAAAKPEAR